MKRLKKEIILTTEKNITDEDKTGKKNILKKKLLIHVIFFFEFLIMQQRVQRVNVSLNCNRVVFITELPGIWRIG